MTKTLDISILNATQKIAAKRAIQTVLRCSVISITFLKADGELRQMMATLNPTALGELGIEYSDKIAANENLDIVTVVDFEEKAWKSFRIDRLVSIGDITVRELIVPITSSI